MNLLMITPAVDLKDSFHGFTHTWVNELGDRVDILFVITLKKGEADLGENVKLFSLDSKKNKISKFIYLNRLLLDIVPRVDIIFTHMFPEFPIFVAPYAKIFKKKIVMWRAHGHVSLTNRISHVLVDKVVTPSKESFRIKSKKVTITGHGIDTDRFKPSLSQKSEEDKKTILSVGRISPVKDYETLIKAADSLIKEKGIKDLNFVIVGGAPIESEEEYFESLKNMVKDLKLKNNVKFVGSVPYDEVVNHYQKCDIFISASQTGSIDKAVLEAMACGKPAITCNEAFEKVFEKYSSILMFKKNDPTNLVNKITHILQMDGIQRNELCHNLRDIVEKGHSIESLADKLIKVFEDIKG